MIFFGGEDYKLVVAVASEDLEKINPNLYFEIGEIIINAIALKNNKVMYRIDIDGIKIGLAGEGVQTEELDELGPIDILGATDHKMVGIIEPKILIPMGNMDFAEVKASVNVEKKLKIKNENSLPATLTIYKLDQLLIFRVK